MAACRVGQLTHCPTGCWPASWSSACPLGPRHSRLQTPLHAVKWGRGRTFSTRSRWRYRRRHAQGPGPNQPRLPAWLAGQPMLALLQERASSHLVILAACS